MTTKISMKNIYLLLIITVLLVGLGIGSSFAMFNAETSIENPISFRSNLTSDSTVIETKEVIVPYKSDKTIDVVISNTLESDLNYDAWYMVDKDNEDNILLGSISEVEGYTSSGLIPGNTSFILNITLRNTSEEDIVVTIGVSSTSSSKLVIPTSAKDIPYGLLPPLVEEKSVDDKINSKETEENVLNTEKNNEEE